MTVSEASAASGIALRPAALEDAEVIARLHDHVWRETYRDLATPAAWEGLTEAVRLARWREVLADQVRWTTLDAEREKQIVGFGSAGAPSEPIFEGRGEVRWLHVAPTLQGMGVGRRLMSALTQALAVQGYEGCALAVVVGNNRAARFYRRLGGREIGRFTDPGPLWRSENIVFAWDELSLLMEAANP